MTASLLFNIVVLVQACMFTSTVASNSAQAGVNEMKAHIHATDSALAAINRHRRTSSTKTPAVTCAICGHRVFPLTADKTGTMHELCSIRMLDESSLPAANYPTDSVQASHRRVVWHMRQGHIAHRQRQGPRELPHHLGSNARRRGETLCT